jgi:hypothetical protein
VVHGVPALGIVVEFEHREIDHPQRLPFAFDQAVALPNSLWPTLTRSAPMASLTILALSAPKKIRSPLQRRCA